MMKDRIINFLLVEDDVVDVMTVQRAFQQSNITHSLCVAGNGLEALALLRSSPPMIPSQRRLILLNLNLPRMGGIEFLQELRADSLLRWIPVVVLTASIEDSDRVEAYKLHVAGYVRKPVTFSSFVKAMAIINQYWILSEMPQG